MPRENFCLSDATRDTLTDNVKAIAGAWNKCPSYVYAILDSEKTDPLAPALSLYTAILKAGVSTAAIDNEFEFLRLKHDRDRPFDSVTIEFTEKLRRHSQTTERYIEALEDGKLTLTEAAELEKLVEKELDVLKLLHNGLKFKKERLSIA
jgi:hypothetical protein